MIDWHDQIQDKKNPSPARASFRVYSRNDLRVFASKGFTLVEILVALVILSTGLLLVIEGMARSQVGIRVGGNLVIAGQIAEEKITESQIEVRQRHTLSAGSSSGRETFPGKVFNWKKDIEPYRHETVKDESKLNQVHVQLGWKEGPRSNNFDVSTLILNREKEEQG